MTESLPSPEPGPVPPPVSPPPPIRILYHPEPPAEPEGYLLGRAPSPWGNYVLIGAVALVFGFLAWLDAVFFGDNWDPLDGYGLLVGPGLIIVYPLFEFLGLLFLGVLFGKLAFWKRRGGRFGVAFSILFVLLWSVLLPFVSLGGFDGGASASGDLSIGLLAGLTAGWVSGLLAIQVVEVPLVGRQWAGVWFGALAGLVFGVMAGWVWSMGLIG